MYMLKALHTLLPQNACVIVELFLHAKLVLQIFYVISHHFTYLKTIFIVNFLEMPSSIGKEIKSPGKVNII